MDKCLIPIIGVTQHFAPPRISAWGGVCSLFRVTRAREYDVDAEKYEGSGVRVGRKHPLFEPRGVLGNCDYYYYPIPKIGQQRRLGCENLVLPIPSLS